MTGPEPVVLPITPPPTGCGRRLPAASDDALDAGLAAEPHDASEGDGDRLPTHVGGGAEARDGAGAGGRCHGIEAELGGHAPDAQRMERVGDEDHVVDVADLEEGGGGGERLPRRLA